MISNTSREPDRIEARKRALNHWTKTYTDDVAELANNIRRHDPSAEEIALPPYEFASFSLAERAIYDHPAVQRLRRVAQLGGASHVFPAAEHTRFPHSIGTLAAATMLMDKIDGNIPRISYTRGRSRQWVVSTPFTAEERILVRLAALLHDVAHIPFGHTLEDELGLTDTHDSRVNVKLVADLEDFAPILAHHNVRFSTQTQRLLNGPPLKVVLDLLYASDIDSVWRQKHQQAPSVIDVVADIICRDASPSQNRYDPSVFRVNLCRELITGPVSADLLDYLRRDRYAAGVEGSPFNPRLLQYLLPMEPATPGADAPPRLVIDLGSRRRVKGDAVTAVHGLLDSRFEMTEVVYRHPVKIASAAMLDRVISHFENVGVLDAQRLADFVAECLRSFADEDHFLRILARTVYERVQEPEIEEISRTADDVLELLTLIALRRLHKTEISFSLAHNVVAFRQSIGAYEGAGGRKRRLLLAESLESDFSLAAGDVVVYSSGPRPGLKRAPLVLAIDGEPVPLLDLKDQESESAATMKRLVGDYFSAQVDRFSSLGRFEVMLSNAAISQLESQGSRALFSQVASLAVTDFASPESREQWETLSQRINPAGTVRLSDRAARAGDLPTDAVYPNGMPRFRFQLLEETN